jgi:hypothetical protein
MWEGAGNRVVDLSGHGNNGDITGASWECSDKGIGLNFTGNPDGVDCGNADSLNITDAVTLSAWVKFNTTSLTYDRIICKGSWKGYQVFSDTDDRVQFRIYTSGATHTTPVTGFLGANEWHHIVATYDKDGGANNQKVYVDGVVNKQITTTGAMDPGTNNVMLGRTESGNHLDGAINNAFMYDCALTDAQVKLLYDDPHFMFRIPEELYGYTVGWLSGYSNRKKITLTGGSSGAQTDYQIKLDVTYDADMQVDFDDLRFTKADGTTLLDAWLESKTDSTSAVVWVKTDTPANTVEADIYMYYGNSGAASDWDIAATFIFGDDFEDGTLDAWQQTTNGSVSGTAHSGSYSALNSKACCSTAYADRIVSNNFTSVHNCIFDFWVRESSRQPFIYLYEDSNNYIELRIDVETHAAMLTAFYLTEGGSLIGNSPDGGDFSKNTWYHCKIVIDGNSAKLYLDTTDATTLRSTYTISNIQNLDFVNFQFVARGGNTYIDDLRIRKYVTNPATYAFGSEEPPSPGNPMWYYNMLRRRN